MIERPEGIIKTMPMKFFEDFGGLERFDRAFMDYCNSSDRAFWYFNLSSKPKYEVLYFYILFDGAVRYRANILDYLPEQEMPVAGGVMWAKCWVRVCAPVIKATEPFPKKGFQGFRYTEKLF